MCGECEEKETFDVMINVRSCTITRQGHSVSWESCKICLWEESCLCVRKKVVFVLGKQQTVCSKINVLN